MLYELFDSFDKELVASIAASKAAEIEDQGKARALQKSHRLHVRRAKSEATLIDILPLTIATGESWHVISHGDVDSLSYLAHLIKGVDFFDQVAISTWCMGAADLDQLEGWIEAGTIEDFALYVGEIFPSQYGDEYARAIDLSERYGFRLVVARNHSKVMLGRSSERSYVIESSANVNTNPRIEQTAIHESAELYDFYQSFFDGLKSIDRRR